MYDPLRTDAANGTRTHRCDGCGHRCSGRGDRPGERERGGRGNRSASDHPRWPNRHWYGIAPEEIEGEENPTLEFEDGEAYELVWINADGAEHELVLESDDGEELEESDSSETGGETVSVTFEADEDVTEYYCAFHPESMRGDVEFDGGFDL